jgi:hypothetical protein
MSDDKNTKDGNDSLWHSGKVTRRRLVGYGTAQIQAILAVYWNLGNHD